MPLFSKTKKEPEEMPKTETVDLNIKKEGQEEESKDDLWDFCLDFATNKPDVLYKARVLYLLENLIK